MIDKKVPLGILSELCLERSRRMDFPAYGLEGLSDRFTAARTTRPDLSHLLSVSDRVPADTYRGAPHA